MDYLYEIHSRFLLLDLGNWYYTWKLDGWNEEIGDSDALQV